MLKRKHSFLRHDQQLVTLHRPQIAVSSGRIMGFLSTLDYSSCSIRGPFVLCSHREWNFYTLHSRFCLSLLTSGKAHISFQRDMKWEISASGCTLSLTEGQDLTCLLLIAL